MQIKNTYVRLDHSLHLKTASSNWRADILKTFKIRTRKSGARFVQWTCWKSCSSPQYILNYTQVSISVSKLWCRVWSYLLPRQEVWVGGEMKLITLCHPMNQTSLNLHHIIRMESVLNLCILMMTLATMENAQGPLPREEKCILMVWGLCPAQLQNLWHLVLWLVVNSSTARQPHWLPCRTEDVDVKEIQ